MDSTSISALLLKHNLVHGDNIIAALSEAYITGRMDGILVAAQALGNAQAQAGSGAPVDDRRARLSADLQHVARDWPGVDLDKQVFIRRTPYRIVGYNRNAPKHAFIIEGPQGGRYKCPGATILDSQR